MWKIKGKKYDLEPFLDKHPGGRRILTACKGDNDLTATFESNHAFCNMQKIEQIMKKYEVGTCDKSNFTFKQNGFYRTLQTRVKSVIYDSKSNCWWNSWLSRRDNDLCPNYRNGRWSIHCPRWGIVEPTHV